METRDRPRTLAELESNQPQEARTLLDTWRRYAVSHPRLEQVDQALVHAIREPAGFSHVLVYGPSGVGKSLMIERLVTRLNGGLPDQVTTPLLLLEPFTSDAPSFNRAHYYRTGLARLGEFSFEARLRMAVEGQLLLEHRGHRVPHFNDTPELRLAYQEALVRHGVRAVILDEAEHLMKVGAGEKLLDQLDWLKSLTNATGVLHILLGPYSLLRFRNLSAQAARRGLNLHFARYHVEDEQDRQDFQAALVTLLEQVPLQADVAALMRHWPTFYAGSIGCIGVLKTWLLRAMAATLDEGGKELTWERVQAYAFPEAECDQMALEATEGEQALGEDGRYREQLWRRLHLERVTAPPAVHPGSVPLAAQGTPGQSTRGDLIPENTPSGPFPIAPPKGTSKGRPGQRKPSRDPIGDVPPEVPAARCSFAGMVDLEPLQLIQAAVLKVACPVCGALRTARLHEQTVAFPTHAPRVTSTPRAVSCWIKQGTEWILSAGGTETG